MAQSPGEDERPAAAAFRLEHAGPAAYERYLVPRFFAPLAAELLADAPAEAGQVVLDLACGTGIVARQAADRVGPRGRVIAVDVNPQMIDVARRLDPHTTIDWQVADAVRLPMPGISVDMVLCQQGWQFLPDQVAAAREAARVLRPGGRLALAVWRAIEHNPVFEVLSRVLDATISADAGRSMRAPFAGPGHSELRAQLTAAGFEAVHRRIAVLDVRFSSVTEFLRQEAAGSPLGGLLAANDAERRSALTAELEIALQSYLDDDGPLLPMQSWLITAPRSAVAEPADSTVG